MKRGLALMAAIAGSAGVPAQSPPMLVGATMPFASSADIRALIAKAAASIRPDQLSLSQPLLTFAPYAATLEYRRAATPPMVHKAEAEVIYVVEGSGILTEGGQLADAKPRDEHNLIGTSVTGGSERHVAAGDVFVIPEGTPHGFTPAPERLVLISMKVPHPAP